jgi:hypothetical protein
MDALKIALETLLIGALALPWLLLGIHLFFPEAKAQLLQRLPGSSDGIQYAIVAVLAVALGYTVGAAVSRLAQDLFNDNDFGLPLPREDKIRASVYCDNNDQPWRFEAGLSQPGDSPKLSLSSLCTQHYARSRGDRESADYGIQQIFSVQESALLLLGEDKTSQIRHLHQQLMVLRGAAFDGAMAFLFCLFAWNARKQTWGRGRLLLPLALFLYILCYALLWNHLEVRELRLLLHPFRHWVPDDPPFLEFAGMLLAAAGLCLAWTSIKAHTVTAHEPAANRLSTATVPATVRPSYQSGLIISFLLTWVAYGGWYWTEVLYDRMVINSFYAIHSKLLP